MATVRLRWAALLRGHIELGTLSLSRPSLNLVRSAAGDWNLAEWLPQPSGALSTRVPVGPSLPSSAVRFRRINVEGGRINFKNGDEKLPLAFVGVKGTVETDRPGRWTMNLDATPWRAAVVVQQAGTIHLSGDLGGTSSRLRPAALDISWTDASISDVLRLAAGNQRSHPRTGRPVGHSGARGTAPGPSLGSRAPARHSLLESGRANEMESRFSGDRLHRHCARGAAFECACLRAHTLESSGIVRGGKISPC